MPLALELELGWDLILQQMDKSTKALTFHKLKAERKKEIQRQGVPVTYHLLSYPFRKYFSFDPALTVRLSDMITQNKYPLQLCDPDGATVLKIKPSDLYFSREERQGKVMIGSDIFFGRGNVEDGTSFFLAKANPTLRAYKDIYSFDQNQYQSQDFDQSVHIIDYLKEKTEEIESHIVINFPPQQDLNQKQNEAIQKSGRNALTFIKGPPGCGKTKTIARLCRLFLEEQLRVIVGAVSNTGNLSIVRELIKELQGYNCHAPLENCYSLLAQKSSDKYYQWLAHYYDHYMPCSVVFYPPFELKEEELPPLLRLYSFDTVVCKNMVRAACGQIPTAFLLQEYRRLKERQQVDNKFYAIFMQATALTLAGARVVIGTTVKSKSINAKLLPHQHFRPHVAILDEASQSSCSDTLCYLKLDVEKLILVGDDKQLNPTVISNDKLLKESFFGKLGQKKEEYFVMLNRQYRMHPAISQISNALFYQGLIQDGVSHQERTSHLPPFSERPVLFINCPYTECQGQEETGLGSKKTYCNPHEVYIIKVYMAYFPREELSKVGIITPYADQLKLLQKQFQNETREYGLTIRTCDGFQGGEKDYIFVSLVRSNPQGNIGFCGQQSRINVTITRARRGMMIIGNAHTFRLSMNYWGIVAQYINDQQAYFDFHHPIPQPDIDAILAPKEESIEDVSKKLAQQNKEQKKEVKKQREGSEFVSLQEYRVQFMKLYPHQSEEVIQAYYNQYINNLLVYYYFDQQFESSNLTPNNINQSQNNSKIKSIISLLQENNEQQEEEEECEKFLKINKTEVRQIRRIDLFSITCTPKKTVDQYIADINAIFDKIPTQSDYIIKRLTPSVRKYFLTYLSNPNPNPQSPYQQLRNLITRISNKDYSQRHVKESENIGWILRWSLLQLLLKGI